MIGLAPPVIAGKCQSRAMRRQSHLLPIALQRGELLGFAAVDGKGVDLVAIEDRPSILALDRRGYNRPAIQRPRKVGLSDIKSMLIRIAGNLARDARYGHDEN